MEGILFKIAVAFLIGAIFLAMMVEMHLKHEAYKAYREAVKKEKANGTE